MVRTRLLGWSWLLASAFGLLGTLSVAHAAAPKADATKVAAQVGPEGMKPRRLAPGIETKIPIDRHEDETFSQHDLTELLKGPHAEALNWQPHGSGQTRTLKSMATQTMFRRDVVWNLEFSFKPLRMIWVDMPQPGGKFESKQIYYMIYRVRNTGQHMQPVQQANGTYKVELVDMDVPFIPIFSLESLQDKKAYLDRILPVAVKAIQEREDPNTKLLTTVEISAKKIPVSRDGKDNSVWGVATWEDVDPKLDYFTVVVEGLSNAHRWNDPPGAFKAGDPPGTGRKIVKKMLQMNFWRPGDEILTDDKVVYFGIPGKVDYLWIYR